METLISILLAIIGGLGFVLFRKSKENTQLKADKSLTERESSSKIVDVKVEDIKKEIKKLENKKNEAVEDKFWKDYFEKKGKK